MKTIKVLGTGCPSCIKLENNVKIALEKTGIEAKIEKVTDIAEIMSYNIMSTPWLVIDEKLVSYWKVTEVNEIIDLLNSWDCSWNNKKRCCCWGNC